MTWRQHIPISQARTGARARYDQLQQLLVGRRRHVLEDVAQVETIKFLFLAEGFFQRAATPFEPIQVASNRFEILFSQCGGQRSVMASGQDPLNIRICRRIQLRKRIFGPLEDLFGDAALDVTKKLVIAAEQAHEPTRKKYAKHKPPAEVVPFLVVERAPLISRFWPQEFPDTLAR